VRILLTGAGGQLGRSLVPALVKHQLSALDRQALDITRLDAVREAVRRLHPDLVLNAAAYNLVDQAESEPHAAYRGNALGPRNLALASAETGAAVLHVSSDYVFDGESSRPYHEFDRTGPLSVYAHLPFCDTLCWYWLYAAGGRNFAHNILGAARQNPEVRVVDDQHGSPTYAPHLAQAIARLIESGSFGTYHLAGRGGTSWYGLTRRLYDTLGTKAVLRPVTTAAFPRPARRPAYAVLTTLQDPEILLPSWEEGVAEFARELA
jgi:dTDP-4-dehydrorhamnose reductase